MKKIFFTLLLITSYSAYSQIGFVNDMNMSPDLYVENFKEIINTVNEKYSHFENKKINKDSLATIYLEKVNVSLSNKEYIDILLQYFGELKNGHSFLKLPIYFIDSWAELIEQKIYIVDVSDSLMIASGIKPKDEILTIDNIPAYTWLIENSKYTGASTVEARINWTAWRVFASYFGGKRKFEIKTDNEIKIIELEFKKINPSILNIKEKLRGKIINDSIGYINIPTMSGSIIDEFQTEFEKVHFLPNLIIDLRDNGGGNSNNSEKILTYLIKSPVQACVTNKKRKPKNNSYQGKIFLLIGTNTFSAAENLVIDLKESNNAIIIGSPTGGDTGNRPKTFTTKQGFKYRFPTRKPPQVSNNGFPMEGIGIKPHFEVCQTIEDFLKNRDTVLEFTIEKITSNSP